MEVILPVVHVKDKDTAVFFKIDHWLCLFVCAAPLPAAARP